MEKYLPIDQALMSSRPDEELELLHTTGLLAELYPEIEAMVGFGGHGQGHKDLWWHTKQVVTQTEPCRAVRWAALFHDVGKVPTFARENGKVSFHGHEIVSARLFDKAARRTGIEDALRKETRFLVRHLGQMESYERGWTDRAVRRFYLQCAKHWDALISLACADITTKHADRRRAHRARMKEVDDRAKKIAKEDAKLPPLPTGLGSVLIEQLEITPGPQLGRWMNQLKEAVEAGELPERADPEVYVEHLRSKLD